jgi:hypothetical protein
MDANNPGQIRMSDAMRLFFTGVVLVSSVASSLVCRSRGRLAWSGGCVWARGHTQIAA